jgi:putative transposase
MAIQRRKFSDDQKLSILKEAEAIGVTAVLRTYNLSYSVFSRWKQKFVKPDIYIKNNTLSGKNKSEMKMLMQENARLKKIIADMALELERKDEELKKTHALLVKRS